MQFRRLITLILALLVLTSLTTSLAFAQDPDNGKVLWEERTACQRCHGPAGEGLWAAPLAGSEKTAQEWVEQVRNPRRNMPHFSVDQVSDEMVVDMHAYLTTLTKPTDFTPADAGLPADAPAGQQLIVEKRCVACHSTTGPVNRFIERGEVPTTMAVINQLRSPAMFMPSFSPDQVSDEEAAQIADFLAAQASTQTAPAALPQSGGANPLAWPVVWLFVGAGLLLAGFVLRRLVVRI